MIYTEKQLLEKKKEISDAKTELSELKGEEKALLKQLKDDWKCNDLSEARKKIKSWEAEATDLTTKIEEKSQELESKLEEIEENEDN
jgi:uncharacterized protein YukE